MMMSAESSNAPSAPPPSAVPLSSASSRVSIIAAPKARVVAVGAGALFGDDDEEDGGAPKEEKKELPTFHYDEGDDVNPAAAAVPAAQQDEVEIDELDQFMMGVEEEHQRALASTSLVSAATKQRKPRGDDRSDEDDVSKYVTKSDEEFFAMGEGGPKKKTLEAVDHDKVVYAPFRKNFYIETEAIKRMTKEEVKALRAKLDHIKVRGADCPKPITKFTETGLPDSVLRVLEKSGFTAPTPIQSQAIPAIMMGLDVIGIAKTGSGKTLAYVLPMIRHVLDQPAIKEREGPIGLILVPTRELALQIHQELVKFKKCGVTSVVVYGGADVSNQIGQLKRGCEVVVATPGRLIDILTLNSGRITNLRRVTYLVLDEADRMFDMGFAPQIQRIIDNVRPSKQAVMFSATFPTSVETLARRALKSAVEIVVGGRLQVCGDVDQIVEVVEEDKKFPILLRALGQWSSQGQILIFSDRQESVDQLFTKLNEAGYKSCLTLHGGKDQLDRISTISDFRSGDADILIATSVAARGLDVPNLVLVINYEAPNHIEDYVHRVGRTGRAGRKGTAITFVTPQEERYAPALVKALSQAGKTVPIRLQEMSTEYERKKAAGEVVVGVRDGYKTKGFLFTEEERKAARSKEMALYGLADIGAEDEEAGSDEDDEKMVSNVPKTQAELIKMLEQVEDPSIRKMDSASAVAGAGGEVSAEALRIAGILPGQRPTNVAELAKMQFAGGIVNIAGGGGAQRAAELAKAFALRAAMPAVGGGGIAGGGGGGVTIAGNAAALDQDDPNVRYMTEVEVNDFPQMVRWKVTSKEATDSMHELFPGVAITCKGSYVPPGRSAMPGERKLYLELIGYSEMSVKLAKREIFRILKETSQDQSSFSKGGSSAAAQRYAKYQVL